MTDPDSSFEIKAADDLGLSAYAWLPSGEPRAVVLIAHGMGEHAKRYGRFARALTGAGYGVYAMDLRGHGETGRRQGILGHFADATGWRLVVSDLAVLREVLGVRHPGLKVVLFAHSMGSLLGQDFLIHHGFSLNAAVLSGTSGGNGVLPWVGVGVAALEARRVGKRGHSPILDRLAMGRYNKAFTPARTEYDWLSRDSEEVDKYIADPLCGFTLTAQSWMDLSRGVYFSESIENQASVPKDLPVFLLSGAEDPVGRSGAGPRWLADRYTQLGLHDVQLRLYPGARHEMLNEINRDEVHNDVLAFLRRTVDQKP